MDITKLPKAYPGNRYVHTATLTGVIDPATITVQLRYGRGGRLVTTQPEVVTQKTPGRGAGSQEVTFSWDTTAKLPYTGWLEISADGQVVRAGELIVTYDHR